MERLSWLLIEVIGKGLKGVSKLNNNFSIKSPLRIATVFKGRKQHGFPRAFQPNQRESSLSNNIPFCFPVRPPNYSH